MVHTLVPMSVKIKIKNFETPARLINHMELSCAVGMACRARTWSAPDPECDEAHKKGKRTEGDHHEDDY